MLEELERMIKVGMSLECYHCGKLNPIDVARCIYCGRNVRRRR